MLSGSEDATNNVPELTYTTSMDRKYRVRNPLKNITTTLTSIPIPIASKSEVKKAPVASNGSMGNGSSPRASSKPKRKQTVRQHPANSKNALAITMSSALTIGNESIFRLFKRETAINLETYINVRVGTKPVAKKMLRDDP
ncbi:hypothetical protein [Agrobacterium pusense]|uniref:hypothetical protein n=1 Tax=Agrobacterium pusense TaxID=648995 RepID=UPI002FDE575A